MNAHIETITRPGYRPMNHVLIESNIGGLTDCGNGRIYYVVMELKEKQVWRHFGKLSTARKYRDKMSNSGRLKVYVGTKIQNWWYVNPSNVID